MRIHKDILVKVGVVFIGSIFILLATVYIRSPHSLPADSSFPNTPDTLTPTLQITGQQITLGGEFICLPHRDQSGPQTMECAFGLKTPEGMYYALRDSDPTKNISGVSTGKKVTVTGIFEPQKDTKYPTEGFIVVQEIR